MSEFGEPWTHKTHRGSHELEISDSARKTVLLVDYGGVVPSEDVADRIVACVNFCREFPTKWLESYSLHKPLDESDRNVAALMLSEVPRFAGLMILQHNESTKGGDATHGQENQTRSGNAEEEHEEEGQGR